MALTRWTLRQIEAFTAVAEAHSFTAGAARLGLTAQAVSQLVAELEAVLGLRLLDRTTRRVALSSAGRDFQATAEGLLRQARALDGAAADIRQRAAGVVRVGAPQVLAATVLPVVMRRYRAQRPKVVVRLRDVAVELLEQSVASGDVDLALGPMASTANDVQVTPVFDSDWVLWCAPDHPLAQRKQRVCWSDLQSTPLVLAGRDHERHLAPLPHHAPENQRATPVDVVDNITTALGLAAQGLAATLSPDYVAALARPMGLVMRRVHAPLEVRGVGLYRSAVRELSPAAQGFVAFLCESLQAGVAPALR